MAEAPKAYAKTEQVLTTLKPADRARLDDHASRQEISRAEAVRTFILDGLDLEAIKAAQIAAAPPKGTSPDR